MKSNLRSSFQLVPETCPAVDGVIDDFIYDLEQRVAPVFWKEVKESIDVVRETVKREGTEKLRSALVDQIDANDELQNTISDQEKQISALESRIEYLESELESIAEDA